MYQPQSAIPTALQALLVLKQQASPVAPGPGGQPIPTVAAQTAQQMMQPPQTQMGPQMPQGTLPGAAQNAGLGNAIEMQKQQAAQKALMDQMLAQQQQPMMAAEGGLASLPASNMDSFAEGGVVGYNGVDDGSYVDPMAGVYMPSSANSDMTLREALGLGNIANRKVLEEIEQIERQRQTSPRQKSAAPAPTPVAPAPVAVPSPAKSDGATPIVSAVDQERLRILIDARNERMVAAANGDPRAQGDVDAINREIAVAARGTFPTSDGSAPKTMPAGFTGETVRRTVPTGIASNIQRPTFATAASEMATAFPEVSDKPLRDKLAGLEALQSQRATPDEAISQLEATRARQREIYQRQLARQGSMPELMAVLGSISKRGDGLTGLEEYRSAKDTAELAQVALDQNLFKEKQLLRDKYLADQIDDKGKLLVIDQELYKNKIERQKLLAQTAVHAFGSQATMYGADVGADQRLQAALIRAETAEDRIKAGLQGKPLYDTINDNVEKQMTAWSQVTTNKYASPEVVAAQRAKFVADQIRFAKAAGHTITPEMEALIKGSSAAPGTRENPIKLD